MEEKRDFKGVWIPREVYLDSRLTALEKIILIEIDSLDTEDSGCFASNEYIAEFCQCSLTKVSLAIKKLISLDYIYVKNFNGRIRILKSRLSKSERQNLNKCNPDFQKVKESNVNNKNKKNNIKYNIYGIYGRIKLTEDEYQKLTDEFGKDYIDKVISALDEYVESNNNKNKYSNYNLVIRKAIREKWFKIDSFSSQSKYEVIWEEAKATTLEEDIEFYKEHPQALPQALKGMDEYDPERAKAIREALKVGN